MIGSGAQIRAARGFLGWSQADLARQAGLSVNAIRWWEAYHGSPLSLLQARSTGLAVIAAVFQQHGLTLAHDPPGVSVNEGYNRFSAPTIYKRRARGRSDILSLVERVATASVGQPLGAGCALVYQRRR